MLSQTFIDEVKNATNMLKLAQRYTELKPVGNGIWQGICPHPKHKDDTPSFTVWEKSQSWACLGCHSGKKSEKYKNYGSDCFAFLQWIEGISWRQAVLKLAEEAGIKPEQEEYQELYNHKRRLALAYHKNLPKPVLDYLFKRGLDKSDINKWLIGFTGQRISFPLFDRYSRIIGFSNRKLLKNDDGPKYKNSFNDEIFNKGSYFYGIHLVNDECDEIRITEGSMDVILPYKYGAQNIVATLGTSFTENHIAIIKNMNKIPVFCMDGDAAGLKALKKSADMLADAGIYSKILLLPDGKDMADLANELKDGIEDYIRTNAITYGQMLIQDIVNQFDAKMNEEKLRLYPMIKKVLEDIKNPDEKKIIKDYINSKMGLNL